MQASNTPQGLNDLIKELKTYREADQHIIRIQKEYYSKFGLLEGIPADKDSADLPLHPKAQINELNYEKVLCSQLAHDLVEEKAKETFFDITFREPPIDISSDEISSMERKSNSTEKRLEFLESETNKIDWDIKTTLESIEKSRNYLLEKTENIIQELDKLHAQEQEIARIDDLVANESRYTLEEAKEILDNQATYFYDINMIMDSRREALTELGWRVEDEEKEISDIEAQLHVAQREADDAVEHNRLKDTTIEQRLAWFNEMTDALNMMVGIESINIESNTMICVKFNGITRESLQIKINPLSRQVMDAKVEGHITFGIL
ncbi:hypothetical protein J3Q64DRAFT_1395537 [Phycomyces blakesleeanus]|uniref:Uncharacterized protein n=1 Tax=Phycomyces blakesleeanus TaxID=4837 RepID=A0ABR3B689_PHYBL